MPTFVVDALTGERRMNKVVLGSMSLLLSFNAFALPKIGFYKEKYSADHGEFGCAQVTSNTKTITVRSKKVTYFEFISATGNHLTCIPQVFLDTDDTDVDGDPPRFIFSSRSVGFCTSSDGLGAVPVSFDTNHVFAGGE